MSPVIFFKETRRIGVRKAWGHFVQRRHLPLVGYLVLASFTGYAFAMERTHSNENREAVVTATQKVLSDSCKRGNELRGVLRGILITSEQLQEKAAAKGQISHAQIEVARHYFDSSIKKLGNTNCAEAYSKLG